MGFMGMDCICASDTASDLLGRVADDMIFELTKELFVEHGRWNTPGFVNVALVFEEVIIPTKRFTHIEEMVRLAKACIRKLEHRLKHKHPQDKFGADYKRMIQSLQKFVRQSKLS